MEGASKMGVEIINRIREKKVPSRRLKKKAQRILDFLNQGEADLSIALVGSPQIQELNARYRNRNEPTDVLSFPSQGTLPKGIKLLGDVVISVEQAAKQAQQRGKSLEEEMESLLIHGILHLLDYDHERSERDAKIMRGMEKKVRRTLCERGS